MTREAAADLLLVIMSLLAAVLYFCFLEAWLLRLMQHAAQRLKPS